MNRKCKTCGTKGNINNILFYGLNAFCDMKCYQDYIDNQKEIKKPITQKKAINKISKKKKQRIKEGGSEVELFKEIWNERKRECEICNKQILEAKSYCFAHRCPKGTYPEHRLKKENISLVCSIQCHQEVDKLFSGIKRAELNLILTNK